MVGCAKPPPTLQEVLRCIVIAPGGQRRAEQNGGLLVGWVKALRNPPQRPCESGRKNGGLRKASTHPTRSSPVHRDRAGWATSRRAEWRVACRVGGDFAEPTTAAVRIGTEEWW